MLKAATFSLSFPWLLEDHKWYNYCVDYEIHNYLGGNKWSLTSFTFPGDSNT